MPNLCKDCPLSNEKLQILNECLCKAIKLIFSMPVSPDKSYSRNNGLIRCQEVMALNQLENESYRHEISLGMSYSFSNMLVNEAIYGSIEVE